MNPIPRIDPPALIGWRLDAKRHAATWDSGTGARLLGGRWNSVGVEAVYAALDPSTAILEVAVHKGFRVLDAQPHVLTAFEVIDPAAVHVVQPQDVPNPNWLNPGTPTEGQQAFGDDLLMTHGAIALPSVVSKQAWNLVLLASRLPAICQLRSQEAFALDPRLTLAKP